MAVTDVRFQVQIHSGDEAMVTEPTVELARELRRIAKVLEEDGLDTTQDTHLVVQILDPSGNRIGAWQLVADTDEEAD